MINIIDNAIKFSKPKSIINIILYEAITSSEDPQKSRHVFIKVEDFGSGISDEDLKNLFKPFFKTKNSKKYSNGLGLYSSHKIAKRLDMDLLVSSKEGEGSVFTLVIECKAGSD